MNNQKREKFSIQKRIKSFSYAFMGLKNLIRNEHNARIHLLALFCVLCLGWILQVSVQEWIAILIVSSMVLVTETLNTAIERLADVVEPKWDERIGIIKDYCAAAVLLSAVFAVAIGLIIFLPKFLIFFGISLL